jgi:hypothetical protein
VHARRPLRHAHLRALRGLQHAARCAARRGSSSKKRVPRGMLRKAGIASHRAQQHARRTQRVSASGSARQTEAAAHAAAGAPPSQRQSARSEPAQVPPQRTHQQPCMLFVTAGPRAASHPTPPSSGTGSLSTRCSHARRWRSRSRTRICSVLFCAASFHPPPRHASLAAGAASITAAPPRPRMLLARATWCVAPLLQRHVRGKQVLQVARARRAAASAARARHARQPAVAPAAPGRAAAARRGCVPGGAAQAEPRSGAHVYTPAGSEGLQAALGRRRLARARRAPPAGAGCAREGRGSGAARERRWPVAARTSADE